ncbi:hypothetical protein [Micromonospora sp. CPCC 206061]|uniref:hypothetical protein n=1 Tax=Micromonospora sp. CPCC 206061 TaxID=3122410 RepID=UPI002FEF3BB6
MKNNDTLGELHVTEMGESQVNGATAVKYNYLTQNADNAIGEVRSAERSAAREAAPGSR